MKWDYEYTKPKNQEVNQASNIKQVKDLTKPNDQIGERVKMVKMHNLDSLTFVQ